MANVTKSMENVAKTTLWQSNESSHLKFLRMNSFKKVSRKPMRKRNYSSGSEEDSKKEDAVR